MVIFKPIILNHQREAQMFIFSMPIHVTQWSRNWCIFKLCFMRPKETKMIDKVMRTNSFISLRKAREILIFFLKKTIMAQKSPLMLIILCFFAWDLQWYDLFLASNIYGIFSFFQLSLCLARDLSIVWMLRCSTRKELAKGF